MTTRSAITTSDSPTITQSITTTAQAPDERRTTPAPSNDRSRQLNRSEPEPERTDTPRHPDLTVILPGPCGPTGKIELRAVGNVAPMAPSQEDAWLWWRARQTTADINATPLRRSA